MRWIPLLLVAACSGKSPEDTDVGDACAYPDFAEPMALNQAIAPYAWDEALRLAEGTLQTLDLASAYCNTDTQFDWSPHDYMLFVSVPAW